MISIAASYKLTSLQLLYTLHMIPLFDKQCFVARKHFLAHSKKYLAPSLYSLAAAMEWS